MGRVHDETLHRVVRTAHHLESRSWRQPGLPGQGSRLEVLVATVPAVPAIGSLSIDDAIRAYQLGAPIVDTGTPPSHIKREIAVWIELFLTLEKRLPPQHDLDFILNSTISPMMMMGRPAMKWNTVSQVQKVCSLLLQSRPIQEALVPLVSKLCWMSVRGNNQGRLRSHSVQ